MGNEAKSHANNWRLKVRVSAKKAMHRSRNITLLIIFLPMGPLIFGDK